MTVSEYTDTFCGKPVRDFRSGDTITDRGAVYRLCQDYEDEQPQAELLAEFLAQVNPAELEALVIGPWANSPDASPEGYLNALVQMRAQLPALRGLFVGDMTFEDCEISWIIQTSYGPLLNAFPRLEELRIRGGNGLSLPVIEHPGLAALTIETGGLPSAVVDAIAASSFPALHRLELWLGDDSYGFDGNLDTYRNLLARIRPERLEYLGLRNAMITDELAEFLSAQMWLGQLHTLDLSMGTLGDDGARALLASPYVKGLEVLDLRHHYVSPPLVEQLLALPIEVLIDDPEGADDDDRYVQVGE